MDLRSAWSRCHQVGFVASNSRANIIVVADEEQLEKVMQVQINADNEGQIYGENLIILEMMKHDQGEEQFEPPQSGCSIFWRGEPIIIVKMWITVLTVFAKCHNSTSKIPLWLNWCIQQQSYKITTILFYRAGVYWIYIVPILPSYLGVISNTLPRACIFQYTP